MHVFVCRGKGFLWHQIRTMINILKGIGKGFLDENIVEEMLDVKNPKFLYFTSLEDPENLLLYNCEYSKEDCDFKPSESN